MRRHLALAGAALLALSTVAGPAVAQNNEPVNADGAYVVANDDGSPAVSGRGKDIVYGDINTGGGGGEVLGDPNAVYSPNTPGHPGPGGGPVVMPGAGDGLIGGVPIQPAAPDNTTTTTTDLATSDGNATENVPIDDVAAESSTTEGDGSSDEAAPLGFCEQYPTWYDAQVAYENLGTTAADPALVQEVDPDYDGIACEGEMA
ncbi:MAG: hypothetical protein IT338_01275 [Thermomicrobiales bacterium]|nr:hypothetical protein [Thermomicrobiales bacterium]